MNRESLSADILSQILIMQSVVIQLPDADSILNFICRGLRDIPGIETAKFSTDTAPPPENSNPGPEQQVFIVSRSNRCFATINISVSDSKAYSLYSPYISNFCNMLGVIFQERHQREKNDSLMKNLEKRVFDRTQELEREVTKRKAFAEALAAETERLNITLRSIGDGVITTDTKGCIVSVNRVAEILTGWTQRKAEGKPLLSVFNIINESTREPCENPAEKTLLTGQIMELQNHTILISRDGTERIIADSCAPIKSADHTIAGVVLVFRDMTEKHNFQETIQRTSKLDSLGVLAGGIAHDFNNLLGGVFGYIDLACDFAENETVKTYLSKTLGAIDSARALTQQLLTFAKGGSPVMSPGRLFPFVREISQFALSGSSVSCSFDLQNRLRDCSFDKNQISQVFNNIVINAQQAMPDGGTIVIAAKNVTLEKKQHPTLPPGEYVKVSVKDQGIGIPKKFLSRIFDPFFTTKAKGHGLGLATCYSIISRHGGCIEAESWPGKGSVFHVILPATSQKKPFNSELQQKKHSGSGTIIVMDDNPVILEIFESMLSTMGYSVVLKTNGKDAVDFFASELRQKREPRALIFDLTIPGAMGGMEAVEQIRMLSKEVPVFVASGYSEDPAMSNPRDFGFTASICKPFTKANLDKLFNTYLTD